MLCLEATISASIHAGSLVLAGIINALFAVLVLSKQPREKANQAFAVLGALISTMLIGDALVFTSSNAIQALRWAWLFELGIDFIPAAFITLIAAFTSPEKENDYLKWLAGAFWILGFVLFVFDRSPFVT